MSERSTFVTDLIRGVAMRDAVMDYLRPCVNSVDFIDTGNDVFIVAGWLKAGWPGGEYETLVDRGALAGGPRLVINCEATKPILWDLATGTFATGILAT